jgi:glutamate 5-kinase
LDVREQIGSASKVVVKIGSSSLTTPQGMIDVDRVDALVDVLAARRRAGTQLVLVSSGAIGGGPGPARAARATA